MKNKVIMLTIFVCIFSLFIVSCKKKAEKTHEENYKEAQSVYNKKGMKGFEKYLKEDKYLPIKTFDENGATPFLLSIKNADFTKVKFFIEKGAAFSEKDDKNFDCIDYALECENTEILKFIVSFMPSDYWNIQDKNNILPCVKFINRCDDFKIVSDVLNLTENISALDKNGKSVLMYAAQNNSDVRIIKLLLDKKPSLLNLKEKNEWTALMYASRYNQNPAVLEDLILRGADSSPNSANLTVTMLASCNKNPGVLLTLFKYKNEASEKNLQGKTALMYACENAQDSSIMKILIDNGADINAEDNEGKSALLYALENCTTPETVYVLLSAGAKKNVTDSKGKSAFDYLEENKNLISTKLKDSLYVLQNTQAESLEPQTSQTEIMETNKSKNDIDKK